MPIGKSAVYVSERDADDGRREATARVTIWKALRIVLNQQLYGCKTGGNLPANLDPPRPNVIA
jgi:hypothetical protein